MTQETNMIDIDDTLSFDDTDVLREVLADTHSRGIMPVSTYGEPNFEENFPETA